LRPQARACNRTASQAPAGRLACLSLAFWEAEEVFFNEPLLVRPDPTHSKREVRHMALGTTDAGRLLFISFTVRRHLIRVISARDMTRKEANTYAHLKA